MNRPDRRPLPRCVYIDVSECNEKNGKKKDEEGGEEEEGWRNIPQLGYENSLEAWGRGLHVGRFPQRVKHDQ